MSSWGMTWVCTWWLPIISTANLEESQRTHQNGRRRSGCAPASEMQSRLDSQRLRCRSTLLVGHDGSCSGGIPATLMFDVRSACCEELRNLRDAFFRSTAHCSAGAPIGVFLPPRDISNHRNLRILHSGSTTQDKGDSRNHGFCRVILFMWLFGLLVLDVDSLCIVAGLL